MTNSYFTQTGRLQAELDTLNKRILFLCENGGYNQKNDWLIGAANQKLDRLRKIQAAYVALNEQSKESRLLGVSAKQIRLATAGTVFPQAEAVLEAAIVEAMNEQNLNTSSKKAKSQETAANA